MTRINAKGDRATAMEDEGPATPHSSGLQAIKPTIVEKAPAEHARMPAKF